MTNAHNQILPENTRIGVYEIKNVLKIDPFNITYHAWNHHLNTWAVVHEYFPCDFAIRGIDGLSVEPKFSKERENFEYGLKEFLKQGEILTRIEHPNIVGAENTLQLNDTAYLIVSNQKGMSSLNLKYSPATFSEATAKFILISMLNALQKIHENNIVHGGINPGAILLSKHGKPVLTDFAAARLALAAHAGKLNSELRPGYAPVEQYEPTKESGPATDFYALGATMYYCMTHSHPVATQDRLIVISKNKPDPMVLLSSSLRTIYNANFLKIIDWMLRPEYNERPQSAADILAVLGSDSIRDQAVFAGLRQETNDIVNKNPAAKEHIWIVVLVGIIVLNVGGLWLGEKSTELLNGSSITTVDSHLSQQSSDLSIIEPMNNEKQPVALVDNVLDIEATENETPVSKKQSAELGEKKRLESRADDNQLEADKIQQPLEADDTLSLLKAQVTPRKTAASDSTKRLLAAAEKAIGEMRFTTPVGNSAYEFYQMVLLADPTNAEALAGLRIIVDKYIRLIEEARVEGLSNTARVYLQRAEAVLPNEPKLQSIRAELNAKDDIN